MKEGKDRELSLLAKAAGEFGAKVLAPSREENDQYPFGPLFEPALTRAFDLGFLHAGLPENLEGLGDRLAPLCALLENVARDDASMAAVILTTAFAQNILLEAGEEERFKSFAGGSWTWADVLMAAPVFRDPTETAPGLTAEKRGETFVLSGKSDYVVLGGIAKRAVLPALDQAGALGYYLVDLGGWGIRKSGPVFSLGLHACPAADLEFSGAEALSVGKAGDGGKLFRAVSQRFSVAAAAVLSGIMRGSFKEAADYAKKRQQGGKEIIRWSELRMILASMVQGVRSTGMLVTEACRLWDAGDPKRRSAALSAFLHAAEAAISATTDGIQALGGVGYMKDFGQEKRFRDAQHLSAAFGILPRKKLALLKLTMAGE